MLWELIAIAVVLIGIRVYRSYTYWERKNVPYLPPTFPMGNLKEVTKKKYSFGIVLNQLYKLSTEPIVGIYLLFRPALLIRDPTIAKMIMTTEFEHFSDRGFKIDHVRDPLSSNLFSLPVHEWKELRSKLTPAFSSGKLKNMFPIILDIGQKFRNTVENAVIANDGAAEMKELCISYIVDIIGSVIFGIEVNSLENKNNQFRDIGQTFNTVRFGMKEIARNIGTFLVPGLNSILRLQTQPAFISNYFRGIVRKTIEYRENNNVTRNDLMQQLIQLRNTGSVNSDNWQTQSSAKKSLSIDECSSNSMLFYIAGSESSSSTLIFCLWELAQQPELMATVQQEIDAVIAKDHGQITYDNIKAMKLVEKCIYETIRKYPALPILNRNCTKTFPIPGTKFVIEKGTGIVIPVMAIQTDPELFPNPLKFNPYRVDETDPDYSTTAYHPFGEGPKSCIGKP